MLEFIVAGFTGTFFSYFCVFWGGVQTHAFALGTVSDRVLEKLEIDNDRTIRYHERMDRKLDKLLRQLDQMGENHQPNSSGSEATF